MSCQKRLNLVTQKTFSRSVFVTGVLYDFMRLNVFFTTFLALVAFSGSLIAQDVRITEFMASSSLRTGPTAVLDEDRDTPDWIEIFNATTNTVNLVNWGLSDDPDRPFRWRFPETNLNAGAFMLVFASGKDRRVPGLPLHTDFELRTSGEHLALTRPDGSVATQFEAVAQAPNVSYGFGLLTTNVTLVGSNAPVRVRVPANDLDDTTWTAVAYDDSGWQAGTNGVGFGSANVAEVDYGGTVQATAPVGYWRFSESSGTATANTGSGVDLDGTAIDETVLGSPGPRPPQLVGFEANNNAATFNGTSTFVTANQPVLNNRNTFTVAGWIKTVGTPVSRVGLFGQNDCVEFGFISTGTLQCWTPSGGSVNATFNPPLNTWHHVAAVGDGINIRVYTNGVQAAVGGTATASYGSSGDNFHIGGGGIFDTTTNWFNGQIDEVAVYHRALSVNEVRSLYSAGTNAAGFSVAPFVKTDIGAIMTNINASARIRLPFTIDNPTNVSLLTLRIRYDDGFSAFINGISAQSANSADPLLFNSAAPATHSPSAAEEFRLGVGTLTAGANVLAIQGLNVAADNLDFLIGAELVATIVSFQSATPLYFTRPTPNAPNSSGVAIPGPAVVETEHKPVVPKDNEDLLITARVLRSLFPVTNVVMRYRVMFGAEIQQEMFDDGLHGDGAAGDNVYGATIPASAATPSQMIRWFFRATDDRGNTSRWPLYLDPANSAEYLGTMVDYQVVSKLPVIHFFAPPAVLQPGPTTTETGADSQAGARVSAFYDGELYDNIHMAVRGNTTQTYEKKSHRVEFNSEHQFRHSDEFPRIGNTSFVAEWPDPAYMRQGLCYWLGNQIGSPAPFYIPWRLQLNGQFYMLANHNDVQDEDQLDRLGFDPNGALYNAAGRVTLPTQSTGGFEKKTRRWETGNPDYNQLATGIAETNALAVRRANTYDFFDIPNAINYLVTARWSHENDDIWANLSLFHDNDGDNLWRIIGFDMNLAWGAIFYEGGDNPRVGTGLPGNVIGTFDAHKGHPLYGSSQNIAGSGPSEPGGSGGSAYNRVYDVFFLVPELREMYLRRLRSMMDAYVKPPGLHPLLYPMENRVRALRDLMLEEATRDRAFWGWAPRGGQCSFLPGIPLAQAADDLINYFIIPRRNHFYATHSITNTSKPIGIGTNNNAGIPLEQPLDAKVVVDQVEYSPASGNQAHEYLTLTNPLPYAVDISDWTLSGGVEFTFAKGTVVPSNRVVYVAPDVRAFKARPTAPRGGMGLFVVGPYRGQLSARGEPLVIRNNAGSLIYSNVYAGSPSPAQQNLRITEIMYNPTAMPGQITPSEEFEFVELKNISATDTLSLAGVRFVEGILFNFTGTLAPLGRIVIVKNAIAFNARYGSGVPVAGEYTGNLDNSGDRLKLVDANNEEIHDFDYEDDWYPITDGGGFSLAIVTEAADPGEWDNKTNWRPSGQENGAPGQGDPAAPAVAGILINEVLTHTDLPFVDTIELFNPTAQAVDLSGWFLTDDFSTAKKYRIPNGTVISAGGYLIFDESHFNPGGNGFALSSAGDEAYLFSGDANTNLTGYAHGYSFGASANGVSFGRHTNSIGDVHFVAQSGVTLPGPNAGPRIGPLIISEFMYRPPDGPRGADNSQDEYIEIHNISDTAVQLGDPVIVQNAWQLRGGVEFDFPPGSTIPAGGFVLVANFDTTDAALVSAFRQKFGVPVGVPIFGPYGGQLNNDSDEIELKRPDVVEDVLVYIMVEQVDYRDEAPWPASADGTAASLHRLGSSFYANDPASWTAAAASAGTGYAGGSGPVIVSQPADRTAVALDSATLSVNATGAALSYQWHFNGANLEGATSSMLTLENLQLDQSGEYSVTVFNSAGAVTSSNATLTVLLGAFITAHPQPVNVRETSNAVMSISVYSGAPPVTYQWQFNGVDIPGATGPILNINGARDVDDGMYRVVVTDQVGPVTSQAARLTVLINPTMLSPVPPLSLTAVAGELLTLRGQLRGTLPIFVRWRLLRTAGGQVTLSPDQTNNQHAISKTFTVGANDSGRIAISITNVAGGSLSQTTTNAFLTVLADSDGDRIPDVYEAANGMNSNDVADATADLDGDTMINRNEYIAGTNPQDPSSYLKIAALAGGLAGGGPATISFIAVSNRSYSVLFSDTLVSPTWSKVGDVSARATNRQASVLDPAFNANRFYRLATPIQP